MQQSRTPRKSPHITAEGFSALQAELKGIWVRRRDVVKALSAAAAEGDRSENAEYIYRKKELRGLDRRIRYLQMRMPELKIVNNDTPAALSRIYFGANVTLTREPGNIVVTYRIVGSDEIDSKRGFISIDSPLSKALLGKQVDDEVIITVAGESIQYFVEGLIYSK